MKIVAESRTFRNVTLYLVQVLDGEEIIEEKTADTITKRDELIWELAEQFNTTNIVIINEEEEKKKRRTRTKEKEKRSVFKFTEIPSIPVLDMVDAKDYFDENESIVYNRILVAIKEGIRADLDRIKLFELAGTGVYVTSSREDWKSGLKGALDYFEEVEEYEKCALCRDLLLTLG